jgi:type I restriction enzyme S subunit
MQKLLTGKLRFKQADGTFFPNWKKQKVSNFLKECIQRVPASTELPIYTSSREGLKLQREYFADRELKNEGEYGVVPEGFFVYRHMSDDLIFKFNINDTGEKIAVSKEYPVFTTNNMDSHFFLCKLNYSYDFKKFATAQKRGGTRTRLYYKNLIEWKTLLPSLLEQQKISAFISSLDSQITKLNQKKLFLEKQKKGLMQQLLTGKTRVKVD